MDSKKNTTPEVNTSGDALEAVPTREEILMSENDILKGLLEAGNAKDDPSNYKPIRIERGGKVLFEFRVRPLTEDESKICRQNATPSLNREQRRAGDKAEADYVKFRSWVIYTATVDEDRKKVWDNRAALDHYNLLQGVDMVDKVLLMGEKHKVLEIIDDISNFDADITDFATQAKN